MKNKALLVGINAYPNPSNQLRGCVNDIVDMENFIASKNKIYQRENIRTLTDSRATKKGILAALDWLILGATAGDQILFQYSGHGAQVPSQIPSFEKDGLDEIICPYDFEDENGAAGTGANAISDKEFAQLFAKIPKGVHFVWISDSCHSEDLSRRLEKEGEENTSTLYRRFNQAPQNKTMDDNLNFRAGSNLSVGLSTLNGALLSGCASHQLSADAFIKDRFNGAFTHYLIQNLTMYGLDVSMQAIIQYVNQDLMENGYQQNPQSEGVMKSKKFFQ